MIQRQIPILAHAVPRIFGEMEKGGVGIVRFRRGIPNITDARPAMLGTAEGELALAVNMPALKTGKMVCNKTHFQFIRNRSQYNAIYALKNSSK